VSKYGTQHFLENIKKGFEKCGIFPCNKDKYPVTRFNKNLKNRYDTWVESGKKPLTAEELDEMTPSKMMNSDSEEENDAPSTSDLSVSNASATFEGKQGKVVSYDNDNPSNMVLMTILATWSFFLAPAVYQAKATLQHLSKNSF